MISIRDIQVEAIHGVHAHERQQSQRFSVSVDVDFDIAAATQSDDLADTIDWSWLQATVIKTVRDNSFQLMERLVHEVAVQILTEPRISRVVVTIEKPEAFDTGLPSIRYELTQN